MHNSTSFALPGPDGVTLHGIVQRPELSGRCPAVVICHGFKGFMEWGFFPPLADLLVERGFVVVRFNYSGSGMRPGDELVTDLDAFRRNSFGKERAETLQILAALDREIAPGRIDRDHVGLLGHSRGGGAALLAAAAPEWRERLGALVTWASIGTVVRFDAATRAAWRRNGTLPLKNARTGQDLELGLEILDDIELRADVLDPVRAGAERRAPWLILHGEADESVPVEEARRLHAQAAPPCELVLLPGGGHTFGVQHPFAGPTPDLIQVLNATQTWLRRYLC